MASPYAQLDPMPLQGVRDLYDKAGEEGVSKSDLLGIDPKTVQCFRRHKQEPIALLYHLRRQKFEALYRNKLEALHRDRMRMGYVRTAVYEDDTVWLSTWIMDDSSDPAAAVVSFKDIESRWKIYAAMLTHLSWVEIYPTRWVSGRGYGNLARGLIMATGLPERSDDYQMTQVFVVKAESDATQAALNVARRYWLDLGSAEDKEARRQGGLASSSKLKEKVNFILREDLRHDSRHGQMIRAQPTAGTEGQQENTQRFHKVSRCLYDEDKTSSSLLGVLERWSRRAGANVPAPTENEKTKGLSVGRYVDALIYELEDKFDALALRDEEGKLIDTVAAFVAEPWVAALGCAGPAENYFPRVRDLCKRRGALLIFDEAMCGMGRTGTLHAWQQPEIGFAPDIMTIGKALGDSTMPAGALMIHKDVNEKLAYGDSLEELPTIPDCLRPVRAISPAVEDIKPHCSMKAHGDVGGEEGVWCEGLRRVFILTKRKIGLSYDNEGNKVKELGELLEREVKKRLAEHDIAPGSSASPVRGIHSRGLFLGIRFSGGAADLSQRAAEIASNSHGVHLRHRDGCLVVAPPLDVTEKEIVDIARGTAATLGEARNEALEAAGALPACRGCRKIQGPAGSRLFSPRL